MKNLVFISIFLLILLSLFSSVSASPDITDLGLAIKKLSVWFLSLFGIGAEECISSHDCCVGGGGLKWACNYGSCDPCAPGARNCVVCPITTSIPTTIVTTSIIPIPTTTIESDCVSGHDCCETDTGWWGCMNGVCDPCLSGTSGCVDCSVTTSAITTTSSSITTTIKESPPLPTTTIPTTIPPVCCCNIECGGNCQWSASCNNLGKFWYRCDDDYCLYTTTTTVPTTVSTTVLTTTIPTTTIETNCVSGHDCCETDTGWWGCMNGVCDPCLSGTNGCVDCSSTTSTTTTVTSTSTTIITTTIKESPPQPTTVTTTILRLCCCYIECGGECQWSNLQCNKLGKFWYRCNDNFCVTTSTSTTVETTVPTTIIPSINFCIRGCSKSSLKSFCIFRCRLFCPVGLC